MNNFYQKAGRKFEKRITKEAGGSNTPGSGNQWYAPGDTDVGLFLIESKLTGQDHYVFDLQYWYKHEMYAMKFGKMPVMILGFYGGQEYMITTLSVWDHIVDESENFLLTKVVRSGKLCTRLHRTLLRKMINRVPGSNLTNIVQFKLAEEEFVIVPKQVFLYLKDLDVISKETGQEGQEP